MIFEPVFFDETFEKRVNVQVDNSFYRKLTFVLEKEGFKYKVDQSGKVLIQRKLSRDIDLMYNFTNKSMDSAWLKQHSYPENF